MFATIPSQWSVVRPLTLVPSAPRNETMLTSVTRDQSSRRRALKAASSHKPNQYPYTVRNPSASYSRCIVRILCPVVVVASSPTFEPQLASLQRLKSTCCQSHDQPASAFEVCSWHLTAKRTSPSSRRSLSPGSARLDIPLHSLKDLHATSEPNSFIQSASKEEVEVTHILSRI